MALIIKLLRSFVPITYDLHQVLPGNAKHGSSCDDGKKIVFQMYT